MPVLPIVPAIVITTSLYGKLIGKSASLSTVLNIKPHNLQKIVRPLSKAGVLITTKGIGGGLKRNGGDISLYDIMSAFYDTPELESDKKHKTINQEYIEALKGIKVFGEWNLLQDWAFQIYEKSKL